MAKSAIRTRATIVRKKVTTKKPVPKKPAARKTASRKAPAKRGPKPNPLKTAQRNLALAQKVVASLEKKLTAATAKRDKAVARVSALEAIGAK